MAWLLRHLAGRRDTEFSWHLDASVPEAVSGDARLLQDLLRKIVESALYLAPRGRIHLEVSAASSEGVLILETAVEAAGEMLFDPGVSHRRSTGPGARTEHRAQAAGSVGGKLATFTEGRRAKLLLTVPFVSGGRRGTGPRRPAGGSASAPLNLLIAEDSDDSFFLLEAYVANEGHRLRARSTARRPSRWSSRANSTSWSWT